MKYYIKYVVYALMRDVCLYERKLWGSLRYRTFPAAFSMRAKYDIRLFSSGFGKAG